MRHLIIAHFIIAIWFQKSYAIFMQNIDDYKITAKVITLLDRQESW